MSERKEAKKKQRVQNAGQPGRAPLLRTFSLARTPYLPRDLRHWVSEFTGQACDVLTQQGRECDRGFKVNSHVDAKQVNCEKYCLKRCPRWLPGSFSDLSPPWVHRCLQTCSSWLPRILDRDLMPTFALLVGDGDEGVRREMKLVSENPVVSLQGVKTDCLSDQGSVEIFARAFSTSDAFVFNKWRLFGLNDSMRSARARRRSPTTTSVCRVCRHTR